MFLAHADDLLFQQLHRVGFIFHNFKICIYLTLTIMNHNIHEAEYTLKTTY